MKPENQLHNVMGKLKSDNSGCQYPWKQIDWIIKSSFDRTGTFEDDYEFMMISLFQILWFTKILQNVSSLIHVLLEWNRGRWRFSWSAAVEFLPLLLLGIAVFYICVENYQECEETRRNLRNSVIASIYWNGQTDVISLFF